MFVTFVSTLYFHDFVEMLGSMLLISIFRDIGVNICTFCHKYNFLFFLYIVWLPIYTCLILLSSNVLTLRVPDDGYSRVARTKLNIYVLIMNKLSTRDDRKSNLNKYCFRLLKLVIFIEVLVHFE